MILFSSVEDDYGMEWAKRIAKQLGRPEWQVYDFAKRAQKNLEIIHNWMKESEGDVNKNLEVIMKLLAGIMTNLDLFDTWAQKIDERLLGRSK
mgnify:CR=1 FL=1